jgi:chromosomal replication initiation ATPase DnaA
VAILTKSLIEGEVLDRCENVLAFGNPGSGKTHLLCAIGQELITRGRRMYFTTSALLVQNLLVAKRDLKLSRFLKKLAHFQGLISMISATCNRVAKRGRCQFRSFNIAQPWNQNRVDLKCGNVNLRNFAYVVVFQ